MIVAIDRRIKQREDEHPKSVAYILHYLVILQIVQFVIVFYKIKTHSMHNQPCELFGC